MLADQLNAAAFQVLLGHGGPGLAELRRGGRELQGQRVTGFVRAIGRAFGQLPTGLVQQLATGLGVIGIVLIRPLVGPVGLGQEAIHAQLGLLLVGDEGVDRSDQRIAINTMRNGLADADIAQDRVRGGVVLGRLDDLNGLDDLDLFLHHLGLDDLDFLRDLDGFDDLDDFFLGGGARGQDHADHDQDTDQDRQLLDGHDVSPPLWM